MTAQPALKVRSHVGRDLLQSSQLFRHEHAVIWEYVANGLEYKELRHSARRIRTN